MKQVRQIEAVLKAATGDMKRHHDARHQPEAFKP